MDYIRFSVDGQRLDYDRKYYSSTDTIDTLYCNFKFETDDLGHILGGWDLPYLWAQFHDEEGNVYIKAVEDNVCSIPHKCLRQLKFKMTLFATDTEDYMTCEKRYTTNEIAFKFKGRANINYDGGVSPDEPMPTQWQLLLDRVDECEEKVDELSQDVATMSDRVDTLSQDVATIDDKVDAIDGRVTSNTNAIDGINTTVDELNTELANESTARESADTRLEGLVNDRYTKAETDALVNAESTARANADTDLQSAISDESTARANADAELQTAIQAEANTRSEAINNVNSTVNELNTSLAEESATRDSADTRLETLINDRYTKAQTDALINDEATARANADANLQSQITGVSNDLSAETTARTNGDANLQSQIDAIVSQSDVVDIVGTHQELVDYDTTHLNENDIVKVLSDSTHDDGKTYYRWSHGAWSYIGTEGITYTKAETDRLINDETTARTSADADLQTQIDNEVTAREKLETEDIPRWFTDESNARVNGDNNLQNNINSLETTVRNNYSTSMSRMDSLDGRITSNTSAIEGINTTVDDLSDTVELLYKTLKKDNSWNELAELVRSGKAEQFLNYGDQIEEDWIDVDNNKAYSNAWDVAKFDDSVESEDGSTFKGMYLKMHYAMLKGVQFSHQRAFYAAADGLEAGTYNITFGADWGKAKNGKTYQFTLSQAVEKGGRLAGFYGMPDTEPATWKVYNYGADGKTLKETVSVIEGSEGTALGALKLNARDGNLNSMHETGYGCNDWEISAMRQYLNSRAGKGAWWTAQDEWDIAPDQLNTTSGFLSGVSDDFYNVMRTVKVTTVKNNPTYAGEIGITYDKVFLPSLEEMYVNPQKTGEGTYYPLMKATCGLETPMAQYGTYPKIITYALENHSSAQIVRLRSAIVGAACYPWLVNSSGVVNSYFASTAVRACPVCVIG